MNASRFCRLRSWLALCAFSLFKFHMALAAPTVAYGAVPKASLVFRNVRQLTYQKSPEVKLARANFEQKSAAVYTAWTRWAPRLDLRLSDTVSKDYSLVTSGSFGSLANAFDFTPTEVDLKAYQLVLQAPLYNRAVQLGVEKSHADLNLAKSQFTLAMARVSWNLRQVFGDYLLQMYRVSTIDRSLRLAASNLQEAQVRFRLGSRTIIDVLKAQAQQAQLDARKVTYESDRTQALARLLDATGLTREDLDSAGLSALTGDEPTLSAAIEAFAGSESAQSEIAQFPTDPADISEHIQKQSEALSEIAFRAHAEVLQAKTLSAGEWPELLLRGTLGKQTGQWGDTFSSGSTSYSYGVVLNIPFFSFGSLLSLGREAQESITATEIRRRQASDGLVNNVQNMILRGRALLKSIDAFRFGVEKNNEIERLTLRTYQLGRATFLDLQIAQNDVVESKIQLAQAQIELAVLIWQIKYNMGSVNEEAL
jgi:outer membrane protein TolC